MKYFKLLKAISLIALTTSIIPFADTFAGMIGDYQYSYQTKSLLMIISFLILTFIFQRLFEKLLGYYNKVNGVIVAIGTFIIGIIPCFIFVFNWNTIIDKLASIILIGFAVTGVVFATVFYPSDYGDVLSFKNIKHAIITQISVIIFFQFINALLFIQRQGMFKYDYTLTFYGMFVMMTVFFISANQSGLDYQMVRGKHDLNFLPPKVRKYSFRMVLLVEIVFFIGILLRDYFKKFLAFIGDLIMQLLRSFFENVGPSGDELIYASQSSSAASGIDKLEPSEPNFLVSLLSFLLIAACFAVVAWGMKGFLKSIIEKIIDLYYNIINEFKSRRKKAGKIVRNKYYSDTDEFIVPKSTKIRRKKPLTVKRWKKEYRVYCKEEAGADKIRNGYILVLKWFKLKGVLIKDSQTANEIFRQNEQKYNFKNFYMATQSYNEVEYSDISYREQQSVMDDMLSELNARLPAR